MKFDLKKMPQRKQRCLSGWLLASSLMLVSTVAYVEEDVLTVVTWGGPYEQSQKAAFFDPFEKETGIKIKTVQYNGGIDILQTSDDSDKVIGDLVDLLMADNLAACHLGLLEPLDHSTLADAPDGTLAADDFYPGSLTECGVSHVIYATVLAFDRRAFPGIKPSKVSDLFDLKRFPGKRALQREPIAVLEWALRAYGVPKQEIYNLLSTNRGIKLAFKKLDLIKDHIVWWQDSAEPASLLAQGKVVMSSGYNGRFFDAAVNHDHPIQIIWDGQLYEYSTWGVPRDAPMSKQAKLFINFATATDRLADQAKYISYGPARASSGDQVWKHDPSGINIRPHLPTFGPNFAAGISKDYEWYAHTQPRLKQQFERWLAE